MVPLRYTDKTSYIIYESFSSLCFTMYTRMQIIYFHLFSVEERKRVCERWYAGDLHSRRRAPVLMDAELRIHRRPSLEPRSVYREGVSGTRKNTPRGLAPLNRGPVPRALFLRCPSTNPKGTDNDSFTARREAERKQSRTCCAPRKAAFSLRFFFFFFFL